MKYKRCAYLLAANGGHLTFGGEHVEHHVAESLKDGARLIVVHDFAPDATDAEISKFGDGVFEGYAAALSVVRSVLGISQLGFL